MITPDGGGQEERRVTRGRTGLIGAAALVIFGGLIAVGALTTTSPDAVETTTTTTTTTDAIEPPIDPENFSVAQIARGEPLSWQQTLSFDDAYPIGLVDHNGALYLFATRQPNITEFDEGGLWGWRSSDGETWDSLGKVIPERQVIAGVSATGQGLVALERGEPGAGFAIWRSTDGIEWDREQVSDSDQEALRFMAPNTVGGTEDLLVVSGFEDLDVSALVEERLGEEYREAVDTGPYGWTVDVTFDDQIFFRLHGPVGLPLATVTAEQMALTDEEKASIVETFQGGGGSFTWRRTDEGWSPVEIPDADFIQWLGALPDGRVLATGYGTGGFSTWATRDGAEWERLPVFPGPTQVDQWGERLVGPASVNGASVVASDGSGGWEEIGPAAYFPDHLTWSIRSVGAGEGGVAVALDGWGMPRQGPTESEDPTLSDNGARLTLEFDSGQYTLETGGETFTWSMGGEGPNGLEADLEQGTLSFHHPDTELRLATFDFDKINQAASEYWSQQSSRESVQAFAFTGSSGSWTIQDLSTFSDPSALAALEVTGSHVIAVRIEASPYFPTSSPGFEVWSAEIP